MQEQKQNKMNNEQFLQDIHNPEFTGKHVIMQSSDGTEWTSTMWYKGGNVYSNATFTGTDADAVTAFEGTGLRFERKGNMLCFGEFN